MSNVQYSQCLLKYKELAKGMAIQEYILDNHCYGCGNFNPRGLKIKSYYDGIDTAYCLYQPEEYYCAGQVDVVNSGIMVMVMDCHCGALALAAEYQKEGRVVGTRPEICYVTASSKMNFLKPTPLKKDLGIMFIAKIMEKSGRKAVMSCSVVTDKFKTATGEVLSVRIK